MAEVVHLVGTESDLHGSRLREALLNDSQFSAELIRIVPNPLRAATWPASETSEGAVTTTEHLHEPSANGSAARCQCPGKRPLRLGL